MNYINRMAIVFITVILAITFTCNFAYARMEPCEEAGCNGNVYASGKVTMRIEETGNDLCDCGYEPSWGMHIFERWGEYRKYVCTECDNVFYVLIRTYTRTFCTKWDQYI
jgi:hypothetical protein